jgi:hypothetical protein
MTGGKASSVVSPFLVNLMPNDYISGYSSMRAAYGHFTVSE